VKTGGPPPGQSFLINFGQQHAALSHWTLAKTAQMLHFQAQMPLTRKIFAITCNHLE